MKNSKFKPLTLNKAKKELQFWENEVGLISKENDRLCLENRQLRVSVSAHKSQQQEDKEQLEASQRNVLRLNKDFTNEVLRLVLEITTNKELHERFQTLWYDTFTEQDNRYLRLETLTLGFLLVLSVFIGVMI